jgi:hypothetical protein
VWRRGGGFAQDEGGGVELEGDAGAAQEGEVEEAISMEGRGQIKD